MTEEDWAWMAERGINTVRIPVSFDGDIYIYIYLLLSRLL